MSSEVNASKPSEVGLQTPVECATKKADDKVDVDAKSSKLDSKNTCDHVDVDSKNESRERCAPSSIGSKDIFNLNSFNREDYYLTSKTASELNKLNEEQENSKKSKKSKSRSKSRSNQRKNRKSKTRYKDSSR